MSPARETIEQPHAEIAAEPEIGLVPGEAAEPGGDKQQEGIDDALRRREPGEQDDSLAFEKGPGKDDRVEAGAVMSNELVDIHGRIFSQARLTALCMAAREDLPLATSNPAMLRVFESLVERNPCTLRSAATRRCEIGFGINRRGDKWKRTRSPKKSMKRSRVLMARGATRCFVGSPPSMSAWSRCCWRSRPSAAPKPPRKC